MGAHEQRSHTCQRRPAVGDRLSNDERRSHTVPAAGRRPAKQRRPFPQRPSGARRAARRNHRLHSPTDSCYFK